MRPAWPGTTESGPRGGFGVAVWELASESEQQPIGESSAVAGARLLERESELSELSRAVDAVSGGDGRGLVITGVAGVGKTSLIAETRRLAADGGLRVLKRRRCDLRTRVSLRRGSPALRAGAGADGRRRALGGPRRDRSGRGGDSRRRRIAGGRRRRGRRLRDLSRALLARRRNRRDGPAGDGGGRLSLRGPAVPPLPRLPRPQDRGPADPDRRRVARRRDRGRSRGARCPRSHPRDLPASSRSPGPARRGWLSRARARRRARGGVRHRVPYRHPRQSLPARRAGQDDRRRAHGAGRGERPARRAPRPSQRLAGGPRSPGWARPRHGRAGPRGRGARRSCAATRSGGARRAERCGGTDRRRPARGDRCARPGAPDRLHPRHRPPGDLRGHRPRGAGRDPSPRGGSARRASRRADNGRQPPPLHRSRRGRVGDRPASGGGGGGDRRGSAEDRDRLPAAGARGAAAGAQAGRPPRPARLSRGARGPLGGNPEVARGPCADPGAERPRRDRPRARRGADLLRPRDRGGRTSGRGDRRTRGAGGGDGARAARRAGVAAFGQRGLYQRRPPPRAEPVRGAPGTGVRAPGPRRSPGRRAARPRAGHLRGNRGARQRPRASAPWPAGGC